MVFTIFTTFWMGSSFNFGKGVELGLGDRVWHPVKARSNWHNLSAETDRPMLSIHAQFTNKTRLASFGVGGRVRLEGKK